VRSIYRRVENIEKKVFSGKNTPKREVKMIDVCTAEEAYAYYLEAVDPQNRHLESLDGEEVEELKRMVDRIDRSIAAPTAIAGVTAEQETAMIKEKRKAFDEQVKNIKAVIQKVGFNNWFPLGERVTTAYKAQSYPGYEKLYLDYNNSELDTTDR
jgi:hypothetical protein